MAPHASPKKNKKSKKREYEEDHEEEEETPTKKKRNSITVDNESGTSDDDQEDTPTISDKFLPPATMLTTIEEFRTYLETNKKTSMAAKNLKHLAVEFVKSKEYDDAMAEKITESMMHYLKTSLRVSCISLDTGLRTMTDFLQRGDIVSAFADFPQRVPSVTVYYAKKKKLAQGPQHMVAIAKALSQDPKGKAECEKEIEELSKKYLSDLEAFFAHHEEVGDLTPNQIIFMKNRIKALQKKHFPVARVPRSSSDKTPAGKKKGTKMEFKTPFEVYCTANRDKYPEYDEEKRIRRLQKKFDKLDEETRSMFDRLSEATRG